MCTKYSTNLAKQLNEGFKRSVYWNSYETKPAKVIKQGVKKVKFQDVKERLFVLAYFVAEAGNDEAGIKNNKLFWNTFFVGVIEEW